MLDQGLDGFRSGEDRQYLDGRLLVLGDNRADQLLMDGDRSQAWLSPFGTLLPQGKPNKFVRR